MLGEVEADVPLVVDLLVQHSARPDLAQALRPDLEMALRAMIASARIVGPSGMGERAALFRLAGLPMERPKDDGAASKMRLANIAERLERATGMRAKLVEAAREADFGHGSGTGDASDGAEAAESLAFSE